ncbi:MAG: 16S rRNA (uracil(1498)-N(3))-methyltransferase [Gammaproteobacteria bacterium]|nr:16S rRNA (uracil(1498)-N(3))-methyltransferase [Gammaproteobacteria bacterium]
MRNPRIYQSIQPETREEIELSEHAIRHLIQVLRLREGDGFTVFNGLGQAWEAKLTSVSKRVVTARIEGILTENPESPLKVHLGLGISKGDRMDYAIQKAVELGVTEITPLFTRYSMVRLDEKRKEKRHQHWQGIIIGACEQCGRNQLPTLHPAQDNQLWLDSRPDETRLTLDPRSANKLTDIPKPTTSLSLYIGPEGGLSEEEITAASQAGFTGIRLGPRVLRTETAVVSAITAVQLHWGDLNS